MSQKIVVGFNPTPTEWRAAQSAFVAAGYLRFASEPRRIAGYTLRFDSRESYDRFVATIEQAGIPATRLFTRIDRRVFPSDLESHPMQSALAWLQVSSEPRGKGGPTYGTKYDLAAGCAQCGTGAPQISALYVP